MNRKRIIYGCGGLAGLSAICIIFSLIYAATPAGKASRTQRAATSAAQSLTETARPTNTTRPTPTVRNTNTPRPSRTPILTRTTTATITQSSTPTETPTLSAAFELLTLSSPVSVNSDAYVVIRTLPGASCSITYQAPGGTISNADGLESQIANDKGNCYWTWRIGPSTRSGEGRITIKANGLTQSFSITIN